VNTGRHQKPGIASHKLSSLDGLFNNPSQDIQVLCRWMLKYYAIDKLNEKTMD